MSRADRIDELLEQVSAIVDEINDDLFRYRETNNDLMIEKRVLLSENQKLRERIEILEEKLWDYSGFIQDLARYYVPDEDWSEVHKAMEDLGIEYVGPDDV